MDPYLLLEVPYSASLEDIKKAYRRLAKLWHPDTNGGSTEAAEKFNKVKAAYDCLIDPVKRAAEDLKRSEQAEAHWQTHKRAHACQPPPGRSGINPGAAIAALFTLVFVVAVLFKLETSSTTAKA